MGLGLGLVGLGGIVRLELCGVCRVIGWLDLLIVNGGLSFMVHSGRIRVE